jgi:hypothetical protein
LLLVHRFAARRNEHVIQLRLMLLGEGDRFMQAPGKQALIVGIDRKDTRKSECRGRPKPELMVFGRRQREVALAIGLIGCIHLILMLGQLLDGNLSRAEFLQALHALRDLALAFRCPHVVDLRLEHVLAGGATNVMAAEQHDGWSRAVCRAELEHGNPREGPLRDCRLPFCSLCSRMAAIRR